MNYSLQQTNKAPLTNSQEIGEWGDQGLAPCSRGVDMVVDPVRTPSVLPLPPLLCSLMHPYITPLLLCTPAGWHSMKPGPQEKIYHGLSQTDVTKREGRSKAYYYGSF